MNTTIVTVGSVTYAVKARRLLLRAGIQTKLIKVDPALSESGCTYGLEFNSYELLKVRAALAAADIAFSVYPQTQL